MFYSRMCDHVFWYKEKKNLEIHLHYSSTKLLAAFSDRPALAKWPWQRSIRSPFSSSSLSGCSRSHPLVIHHCWNENCSTSNNETLSVQLLHRCLQHIWPAAVFFFTDPRSTAKQSFVNVSQNSLLTRRTRHTSDWFNPRSWHRALITFTRPVIILESNLGFLVAILNN